MTWFAFLTVFSGGVLVGATLTAFMAWGYANGFRYGFLHGVWTGHDEAAEDFDDRPTHTEADGTPRGFGG